MIYGCHNKPRPTRDSEYTAQNGWLDTGISKAYSPVRIALRIEIKSAFGTTSCQYDKSAADTKCSGCQWAKTG